MQSKSHLIYLIVISLLIFSATEICHAKERADSLQQKMAEISLLQSQLNERKGEAVEMREKLYEQLAAYKKEIETIKAQEKLKSLYEAQKNPRIRNNLQLCGEIYYYIDQFNQKIRFYQIGQDKLDYLYQEADDDLKIINTLTSLKIEALLAQIDTVIFEYLPEAHRILIDIDTFRRVKLEAVWQKFTLN